MNIEGRFKDLFKFVEENKIKIEDALEIYTKYSCRLYKRNLKRTKDTKIFDVKIEKQVLKLTKRYLRMYEK